MQRKPTNRKHLGRPILPEAERLSCDVHARLTQAERVALEDAADAAGVPLAEYVRLAIVEKIGRDGKCDA